MAPSLAGPRRRAIAALVASGGRIVHPAAGPIVVVGEGSTRGRAMIELPMSEHSLTRRERRERPTAVIVLPAYTVCAPAIDTRTISGGMPKRTGTLEQPSPPDTTKSHCSRI